MSHFVCLIVTPSKPTQADLSRILAPYKEDQNETKWDWWVIGGRWSGYFTPGYDPFNDPDNLEVCGCCAGTGVRKDSIAVNAGMHTKIINKPGHPRHGQKGWCNACDGTGKRLKFELKNVGSQVCIANLELDALRIAAAKKAGEKWDHFQTALAGRRFPDFKSLEKRHGREKALEMYSADPAVQSVREAAFIFLRDGEEETFLGSREAYCVAAYERALTPFAFVKDGQWRERGEMGSFAIVSDEKKPEVWHLEFSKMLDSLKPTDWLTVVDCHI